MKIKDRKMDPFTWENISIRKYYTIKDILDSGMSDLDKNVALASAVSGIAEDDIWDMSIENAGDLISSLGFMLHFELLKKCPKTIVLGEWKLKVCDLDTFTFAQYVDYQNFCKGKLRDNFTRILSTFLIPEGKAYNTGYDIITLQEDLWDLNFRTGESLLGFFLKRSADSIQDSLAYCRKMLPKMKGEKKKELEKKMDEMDGLLERMTLMGGSV